MNVRKGVYSRRGVWLARLMLLLSSIALCIFVAGWAWSQSTIEGVPTGAELLIQTGIAIFAALAIAAGTLVFTTGDPLVTVRGKELNSYVVASCQDSILQLDDSLRLVAMNPAAERKFGFTAQTVRGSHFRNLPSVLLRREGNEIPPSGTQRVAPAPITAAGARAGTSIAARELAFRAGIRLAYLSTPLLGYAELVMAQLGADHPSRADLEEIGRSSVQVVLLAKVLEVYGGVRHMRWVEKDLNQFLKEIEPDLKLLLKSSTRIVLEPAAAPANGEKRTVAADPELTRLLIMLLARNAEEAMPHGGELRIRAEANALLIRDQGAGFSNSGIGVTTFDPVFEARREAGDPERGVGLGLHVAHTAAILQGAELTLEQTGHSGSEFRLSFGSPGGTTGNGEAAEQRPAISTRQLVTRGSVSEG